MTRDTIKPYVGPIPQRLYHGNEADFHFDASRQATKCIFFAANELDARTYAQPPRRANGHVFTCAVRLGRPAEFANEYELISYGQGFGEPLIAYPKAGKRLRAEGFDAAVILDNAAGGIDFVVWDSSLIAVLSAEPC